MRKQKDGDKNETKKEMEWKQMGKEGTKCKWKKEPNEYKEA
jgi:hypothetical protein